jgi:GNAT superfamily N-acetyltransferase
MSIYQITKEQAPLISGNYPEPVIANIGQVGFTTLAYFDEEAFLAGILQFCVENSTVRREVTAFITYLYVEETFRNGQIATLLLDQLVSIVENAGISAIEVALLTDVDSHENLKQFFLHKDFVFTDERPLFSATVEDYLSFPIFSRSPKSEIDDLTLLSAKEFSDLLGRLTPKDSPIPRDVNDFEKSVSSYYSTGSSLGMLLVRKRADTVLEVVLFAYTGTESSSRQLDLILSTAKKVRELYPSHTNIRVVASNNDSKMLLNHLCPGIEPSGIIHGSYVIPGYSQ